MTASTATSPKVSVPSAQEQEQQQQEAEASRAKEEASNASSARTNDVKNIMNDDDSILTTTTKIVREGVKKEIAKKVLRQKLSKLRHLVIPGGIQASYLDSLFPQMLSEFHPQVVHYNGGIANVKEWKISCYLEVMEGGIPCTDPNLKLLELFQPLLDNCNDLFLEWYRQQHACNNSSKLGVVVERSCKRLMTFITRYTPNPGEQALLKHVDGAGKVSGSCVVALPVDRWSGPEQDNKFEGGGLTFWDGKDHATKCAKEIHYDTKSGDLAFIDRAVWHQADPITKGTRWALVIFYDVVETTTKVAQ